MMVFIIISGLEHVDVPEALVKELATLRLDFAKLLLKYEKELQNSPEAKQKLVELLPWLFPNVHELVRSQLLVSI